MEVKGSGRTLVTTYDTMQCHNPDSYSSKVPKTINNKFGGGDVKDETVQFH